jgi:GDP/UDP-N,N'-diacetylbacillosamine 2-epimerase (hydrolysing)
MKLGFITTSRADFGIYLPLLKACEAQGWTYLVFAGGMHTSSKYGNSHRLIEDEYKIRIAEKITSLGENDDPQDIAVAMGATTSAFGKLWNKYTDLRMMFALGDRYEMFCAALSCVPFNIPIAHLHGGETSLGAMDNKFRHALTSIASYHFVSAAEHAARVVQIIGDESNVFNVGALGLEGIRTTEVYSRQEFSNRFGIAMEDKFVLVTYHPETIELKNDEFADQLIGALQQIPYKILCTLPNADTQGSVIRSKLLRFANEQPAKIRCFENLGQRGYYSAMCYCTMLIGNTSSGIIEAASYHKPVVNVGNRQKGRLTSDNVIHVDNDASQIVNAVLFASEQLVGKTFVNRYGDGNSSGRIVAALKQVS